MNKLTLLVLAAGMGSRYGGLKQIDPVGPNGETIIDYSTYDALRAGFGKLVFVIHEFLQKSGGEPKSENYIPSTVNDLVVARQARVKVLRTTDSWFGVTYREDRPRAVESVRQLIARGDYPEKLWT
jgi:hypothetical protein